MGIGVKEDMEPEDKNVREVSLLMLGACTISGLGLPGTLSLPVLLSRAFRRQPDVRLRIEAENHIDSLGQLLALLEGGKFRNPWDIVMLQSMIGRETIPQLGVAERMDRPGLPGGLYRMARSLAASPSGHRLVNYLRLRLGYRKSSLQHYRSLLESCLKVFRNVSPGVKIIVLGQGLPVSKARSVFTAIYDQNRRYLIELASENDFDFIDLKPLLICHKTDEIYQADGLHFTAAGQRIVAQAIIDRIRASGIVNR